MKEILIKEPKQARSKATFTRILEASAQVLLDYDFKKSTAAKIALEADVGIGSFYDYFSCKEAAFIAYLDRELDQALEEALLRLDPEQGPRKQLSQLVRVGVHFAYQQAPIIKMLITHLPGELQHINLNKSQMRLGQIALNFAQNKSLKFVNKNPELILYTLTNLLLGFQMRIVLMPNESFDQETLVEEITGIIYDYLFVS